MRDPVDEFFAGYTSAIQAVSRSLRAVVRDAMPKAHEVLVARQNHVGYGFSESMGDRVIYIQ